MQPIFSGRLPQLFLLASLWLCVSMEPCNQTALAMETQDEKEPEGNAISPKVSQSTLEVSGKSIKARALPGDQAIGQSSEFSPLDSNLRISLADIRYFPEGSPMPKWVIKNPDSLHLFLAAKDEQVFYILEENLRLGRESKTRIRRLAVADGKWQEDLNVQSKIKPAQLETIINVATSQNSIAVLSGIFEEDKAYAKHKLISYRVSLFAPKAISPSWTQSFSAAGEEFSPGIFFHSLSRLPPQEFPAIQSLVFLQKELLVCAGSVQDVLSLDYKTGKVIWKIERIWEFERGHHGLKSPGLIMSRFGEPFYKEPDDSAPKKERVANPEMFQSILGGPIVVNRSQNPERPNRAIYVAIARGQKRFYGSHYECQVYEINSRGAVVGVVTLPRPVVAGKFKVWNNGLFWACEDGSIVRLASVIDENEISSNRSAREDCITNIDWFIQARSPQKPTRRTTERIEDFTAFGDGIAALVPSSGYIPEPSSKTFHFPIAIANLNSGQFQYLEIKVPFEGKIPEPVAPMLVERPGGKKIWITQTPPTYQFTITDLGISKSSLRVRFGTKKSQKTSVEFPLAEIPGLPNQ